MATVGVKQCPIISADSQNLGQQVGGGNGMMTDPYPHPQHLKVVNHVIYVWVWEPFHMGLETRRLRHGIIWIFICQDITC